jgi:hypothetical protein
MQSNTLNKRFTIQNILFLAALGLLSLAGMLFLRESTPFGFGLSNDSAAYVAGARSIMQGQGYVDSWLDGHLEPITHYPPLFSIVLAAFGTLSGMDPIRSARLINGLFYGGNIILLGLLGRKMTRSNVAGFVLALLFTASGPLFRVSAYVLSEPLFIFLGLLGFLFFASYFDTRRRSWLVASGIAIGLSCLARYTGLAILATFIVALVLLSGHWRNWLADFGIFLGSSLPWFIAWLVRNELVAGNATNRVWAWHPLTQKKINYGVSRLSYLFIPVDDWRSRLLLLTKIFYVVLLLVGLVILAWLLFTWWRYSLKKTAPVSQINLLAFLSGLYIFGYLLSMVVAMSLYDPATRFQDRILAPVMICLLTLAVAGGMWLWRTHRPALQIGVLTVLGFALVTQGLYLFQVADYIRNNGLGYDSWRWRDADSVNFIQQLPDSVFIYSNSAPAVYLTTGKPSRIMPRVYNENASQADYDQALADFKEQIWQEKAVLVIFDARNIDEDSDIQTNLDIVTSDLKLYRKYGDDYIYMGRP